MGYLCSNWSPILLSLLAMFEGLFKKGTYLFLDRIIRLAVSLVSGAMIARALGPQEFGVFAQVLVALSLFDTLAGLGIGGVIAARITQIRVDRRSRFLILATSIRMIFALVLLFIVWVSAQFFISDAIIIPDRFLLLCIFTGVLFNNWLIIEGYLNGIGFPHYASISKSVIAVSALLIRYLYIDDYGGSLEGFLVIFLVEQVLLTLLIVLMCFRSQPKNSDAVDTSLIPNLFPSTLIMWISQISILIYMRIDQLVLSKYASKSVIGMYMLSVSVVELTFTLPIMMNALFIAYIGDIRANGRVPSFDFYQRMSFIYRVGFFVSLLLVLFLIIIADPLIVIMYGDQYEDAIPIFRILIMSLPFVTLGSIQLMSIYTGDDPFIHLRKTIAVAMITPFFAVIGWHVKGVYGLAWSVVLSQVMSCYFINIFYDKNSFMAQSRAIFFSEFK